MVYTQCEIKRTLKTLLTSQATCKFELRLNYASISALKKGKQYFIVGKLSGMMPNFPEEPTEYFLDIHSYFLDCFKWIYTVSGSS